MMLKQDIYAYNPNYEWTSHKTYVGLILSWISIAFIVFYMFITTRDYITRPPELVSQGQIDLLTVSQEYPFDIPKIGFMLQYENVSDKNSPGPQYAMNRNNPFVRLQIKHVVMKDQQRISEEILPFDLCTVSSRPSICPIFNTTRHKLKGTFYKENYEFLEVMIRKCMDEPECVSLSEINALLLSGDFRIRVQVSLEAEQFDVEQYHLTGTGRVISNRSMDFYAMPNIEISAEIILQANTVSQENRHIGSPPIPETSINILSFFGRETAYIPRMPTEANFMTFNIRLADTLREEEVSYWCPSILDLFGLWGAMMSFITALSLGFMAIQYNKWSFHRHFKNAMLQKRFAAQRQTYAAMQWIRNNPNPSFLESRNRNEMYNNLQIQYDALMVEPDIRLFENHHFDSKGRMIISPAELKFPSTPFGELRRLALLEHGKKKRAAEFISVWYARHLIKKGFIRDEERRRQVFVVDPAKFTTETTTATTVWNSYPSIANTIFSNKLWQNLRSRKRHVSSTLLPVVDTGFDANAKNRCENVNYKEQQDGIPATPVETEHGNKRLRNGKS